MVWLIHDLVYCQVDPSHVVLNGSSSLQKIMRFTDYRRTLKIISPLTEDPAYPSLPIALLLLWFSHPNFQEKARENMKWREGCEQLRMPGLPDYLLNNLTSVSLNSCLALIFATKFYIVAEVFGNIKNWFSAKNCVFMAGLLVV